MSQTPESLRIYFDQLKIPFLLRDVPAPTFDKPEIIENLRSQPFCEPFRKARPRLKFTAEYPSETNRQVRDYLHSRLGKTICLRGSEWEIGRGVLTGLSFTVPFPLLDTEPWDVTVLIDEWTLNVIGSGYTPSNPN